MQIEILTKNDLEEFRNEILLALAELSKQQLPQQKEWLRSKEVRQLLGISNGTLQNLRVKGLLNPAKIEGVYLYHLKEILTLLDASRE